jgi:hypothetical protein
MAERLVTDPARMFDPIEPFDLFNPSLPSTMSLTKKVIVTPNQDDKKQFFLSWTPQAAAVRYILRASANPGTRRKFGEANANQTSAVFELPIIVPSDMTFYFWVSYRNQFGQEQFILDAPVHTMNDTAFTFSPLSEVVERDIITDADMKFYPEEIRRRHLAVLQMNGEVFDLYLRRRFGQPCICITKQAGQQGRTFPVSTSDYTKLGTDFDPAEPKKFELDRAKDPGYQAVTRCDECFGTGIAGGYYPKIRIFVRYGEAPLRAYKRNEQGMELRHDFNSWTLFHPKLKAGDFIHRIRNNERFSVVDPGQSEMRGVPWRQLFRAVHLPDSDMVYKVNDDKILQALQNESVYSVGKWSWAVWS